MKTVLKYAGAKWSIAQAIAEMSLGAFRGVVHKEDFICMSEAERLNV